MSVCNECYSLPTIVVILWWLLLIFSDVITMQCITVLSEIVILVRYCVCNSIVDDIAIHCYSTFVDNIVVVIVIDKANIFFDNVKIMVFNVWRNVDNESDNESIMWYNVVVLLY